MVSGMLQREIAMSGQQSTRAAISDGVITARVRSALVEDPITAGYEIHVETLSGIVELTGFVDTAMVRVEALHVAEHIDGVLRVQDLLDVRGFD
jgi:hyperosmotically inducible periplasmic protein